MSIAFAWCKRSVAIAVAGAVAFTTVGVPEASAAYGRWDDTVYRSLVSCKTRGGALKVVGLIDDYVCAKGYTQNVVPQRYGILLWICRNDDPNPDFRCGEGSWRSTP